MSSNKFMSPHLADGPNGGISIRQGAMSMIQSSDATLKPQDIRKTLHVFQDDIININKDEET